MNDRDAVMMTAMIMTVVSAIGTDHDVESVSGAIDPIVFPYLAGKYRKPAVKLFKAVKAVIDEVKAGESDEPETDSTSKFMYGL